jgi:hypothetical protein
MDAHLRVEGHVFRNVADALAGLQALRDDVEAAYPRRPRRRMEIAREDAQDRALARAVRTEKAQHLAGPHVERNVAHGAACAVMLGQVLDEDDGRLCAVRIRAQS